MREYVGNKLNDTCTSGKCIYNDSNTTLSIENSPHLSSLHPHFTKLCFLCVLYRLLPRVVPSHGRECVWLLELGHGGGSSAGACTYVWFRAILVFSVTKFFSILKLCRNVREYRRKVHVFLPDFYWEMNCQETLSIIVDLWRKE